MHSIPCSSQEGALSLASDGPGQEEGVGFEAVSAAFATYPQQAPLRHFAGRIPAAFRPAVWQRFGSDDAARV